MKNKISNSLTIVFAALVMLCATSARAQAGLNANIKAAEPKTTRFTAVAMVTGSSVAVTNTSTPFTSATFYGYKAWSATGAPTTNAASAWIGFATQNTDGTHSATNLVDTVAAGSSLSIQAPPGTKFDLSDIVFNGTTGDKIFVTFEQ